MEVHFAPETEERLKKLSAETGRATDDLIEDAMSGYFGEALHAQDILNSRYDDLKSGRVKPIPGEEVEAYFHDKSATARRTQPRK